MSNTTPLSPTSLFSRIETLKKWQTEQQQRLLQQQSQQSKFLLNEHKRLHEALSVQEKGNENISNDIEESSSVYINNQDISSNHHDQIEYSEEETDNDVYDNSEYINHSNVDEMPIKSPMKDFNALLDEKLRENETPVLSQCGKPKRKFLKKGAGLSRFRMTINDLAHKKPKPKLPINKNKQEPLQVQQNKPRLKEVPKINQEIIVKENLIINAEAKINFQESNIRRNSDLKATRNTAKNKSSVFSKIQPLNLCSQKLVPNKKHSDFDNALQQSSKMKFSEPQAVWTPVQEENPTDYQALLAELIEVRQSNPALFDTPMINKSAENDQQIFEKELLDELKLFEVLEQKAMNSSFCSTSSLITKLMEHPIRSTPKKQIDLNFLTRGIPEEDPVIEVKKISTPPKRKVSFSDQSRAKQHEEETDTFTSNEDSDSDTSQDSNSSINSDDICNIKTIVPTKFQNEKTIKNTVIFKDVATNTDQPIVNSELLKTRLEQLENELETFRSENARVNKLKAQLETDQRNFEKRKRQLEKEVEEQKMKVKTQLDEERAKLAKDRSVYDRYVREMREGKSARQKDKEELSALRSKLTSLEEEMKLKESKWGATQARIRSQLKHLEKENATLRTENNELRTKNGKLEATNKQLLTRRPTDTKVLHEINKNLTKIAQESKEKVEPNIKRKSSENVSRRKSIDKNKSENAHPRTRSHSRNRNSSPPRMHENEENKENKRYSLNSTDESKSSTDHSFESVEREYEKLFGKSYHEQEEHAKLPAAEASSCTDMSGKREEIVLEDGSIRITYPNGNVRTISSDGQIIVMQYHNGDVKETCKETGIIKYLFSDAKTWHTTFPDGMELLEFPNGQIEKRFPDGSSEIHFPNGSRRCTSPGGTEQVSFPDGTLLLTKSASGERILTLPNGQREIHTRDHKRREYPDGTIKLLYPDGVQETRYANGRIRLKDKQGNLIMDSATV